MPTRWTRCWRRSAAASWRSCCSQVGCGRGRGGADVQRGLARLLLLMLCRHCHRPCPCRPEQHHLWPRFFTACFLLARAAVLRLHQQQPPILPPPLPATSPARAVAFAGGTLPDAILSLQLPAARQSALFLPRLGSLPLLVPLTTDLLLCNYSPADAALGSYYSVQAADPYLQ